MQIRSRRRLIRLSAAFALILCGSAAWAEPALRLSGSITLERAAPWFGGWSAIEVSDGGAQMIALSDRGRVMRAQMARHDGQLHGIKVTSSAPLRDRDGRPLKKEKRDAEGLAIGSDGSAYASFENRNRIMRIDPDNGMLSERIDMPFTRDVGRNAGVEALSIDPKGALFALAEQAPAQGAPFLLYALRSDTWQLAATIPQRGPFVPVGADFDPKGRLWLLERAATLLGFRSRIRLFDLSPEAPREYTLLTSLPAQFDNLEGLSVWTDAAGNLRVTMISDDNFLHIQKTQIVEYTVEE